MLNINEYRMKAEQNWIMDGVNIHVLSIDENGKRSAMTNVEFTELNEAYIDTSSIHLDRTAAQYLMDSLYMCGIRPTEENNSLEVVKAKQQHIEDLRKSHDVLLKLAEETK